MFSGMAYVLDIYAYSNSRNSDDNNAWIHTDIYT